MLLWEGRDLGTIEFLSTRSRVSLIHFNQDRVAAQAKDKPLAFCDQTHDHSAPVLEQEVARAPRAQRKAIASLDVRAGEVAQPLQSVDLTFGLDLRDADSADAQPTDGESISMPPVPEDPFTRIAATDIGRLDLGHFHVTRRRLTSRAGRGGPGGADGENGHQSGDINWEEYGSEPPRFRANSGPAAGCSEGEG
jgi:hypothetical protein